MESPGKKNLEIILGQVQLIVGLITGKICPRPLPHKITLSTWKKKIKTPCNTLLSYDCLNGSGHHAAISVTSRREGRLWKEREKEMLGSRA